MRYAIVSDIHANLRAWNAVLADFCEQGADVVVCLGDVVGYGPHPAEVLNSVRAVSKNFVMGNHDAAAAGIMDYSIFNDHACQAIEWTMAALDPEAKQFLSSMPLAIDAGEILFVHAEISEPGRFDYISDPNIAKENFKANQHLVTFVGHTHLPKIFELSQNGDVAELPDNDTHLEEGRRYIVNVGSVGEPRDLEDLRARYVIYDSETRDVVFRRVEFDIVSYRNDLEATTLVLRPFFLRRYEEVIEGREASVANEGSIVDMNVSHESASLVDLGQVARVANLSGSGAHPKVTRPSRARFAILAIAAILTVGVLGFWLIREFKEPMPQPPVAAAKPEPVEKPTIVQKKAPVVPEVETPEPELIPTPARVTNAPDEPKPIAIPASKPPEPEPEPKPELEPEPEPVPEVATKEVEVAWWRMGDEQDGDALVDQDGQVSLITINHGKTIRALAPDPVPGNEAKNSAAKQLGIWQEEKPGNHFALRADRSFTFEGWFFIGKIRKPVFLFGTRSSREDGRGWHLDLRPGALGAKGNSISFFYDSGKNQTQAIAENLPLDDGAAHHFAIIWDHDESPSQGAMQLYLDGEQVASAKLPHAQIAGEQSHPFRIGADFNPERVGLDELRFTRKALQPNEFLMRGEVRGIAIVKADGSLDSWGVPGNWEDGKVPSGVQNVIISPGLMVQIFKSKPPPFAGSLVLKEKASLHLHSGQSEVVIPKTEGSIVMFKDSQLFLRAKEESKLGPIELMEPANIFGGIANSGHNATRTFASRISGPGGLTLIGVNGNTFVFEMASTFSGGLTTKPQLTQNSKVIAAANTCFGKGRVVIGDHSSLQIREGLEDTVADHAGLILKGPKGSLDSKLVLGSDETVGSFVVDDVDQGKGVFTKTSHPEIISGDGKLTVK